MNKSLAKKFFCQAWHGLMKAYGIIVECEFCKDKNKVNED